MINETIKIEPTVEEATLPKLSRLSILRKLLNEECGYTKVELAERTGLKLSTVNCQLYYHLPTKGFVVEKLEGKKVRFGKEVV